METTQERPTGITILAILQVLGGIASVLAGIGLLGLSGNSEVAAEAGALASLMGPLGVVGIVLGIAAVILGVGMWQLRSWAWLGTLIVQSLGALANLVSILDGRWTALGSIVVSVIIIAYLLKSHVKAAFGR